MLKYWFYLNESVYVDIKGGNVLLYNTVNGDYMNVALKEVVSLIMEVNNPDNLGSVLIEEEMLSDKRIKTAIDEIRNEKMGGLLKCSLQSMDKPVFLRPLLNINKDVDKLLDKKGAESYLKKDISKYLLNMNIYLNGSCGRDCVSCKNYHLQFNCCTKFDGLKEDMPFDKLYKIFEQVENFPFREVNFLGGNIYLYKYLNLMDKIKTKKEMRFYIYYKNYRRHEFIDTKHIDLMIDFPVNQKLLVSAISKLDMSKVTLHFIVTDEAEVEEVNQYTNSYGAMDYVMHPFFTTQNCSFFKENVFISEDDLQSCKLTMREIFRNQKINANFFGNFYILPDGSVKANMNTRTLANIDDTGIMDIIYREWIENTAWRAIRNFTPCNDCLFQFICPPISNYEYSLGCKSLCHVKNESNKMSFK